MTYRINPGHFIENGPTLTAAAARARFRTAARFVAIEQHKREQLEGAA